MYTITQDYIRHGNARSGAKMPRVRFLVAHDIGKGASTARNNRNYFHNHQPSASAHTFIDDTEILEIVPLGEKAYHVRYNVTGDNRLYGDDANDIAIGTELCHGGKINFMEAYKRFVWYHAYLCKKYGLNPRKDIISHKALDPARRSDPQHALEPQGITWEDFIDDVVEVFNTGNVNVKIESTKGDGNVLSKGSKGLAVRELQNNLITLEYFSVGTPDGIYGDATVTAVTNFQKNQGLVADGIAGVNTLNKLADLIDAKKKVVAPKAKESCEITLGGKKYRITEV